jgi:aromatic ring hydroxylase
MPKAKVLQWLLLSYALHSAHSKRRKSLCQRGERVGLFFITPRTIQDLERRRTMIAHWARVSCGMPAPAPLMVARNLFIRMYPPAWQKFCTSLVRAA